MQVMYQLQQKGRKGLWVPAFREPMPGPEARAMMRRMEKEAPLGDYRLVAALEVQAEAA